MRLRAGQRDAFVAGRCGVLIVYRGGYAGTGSEREILQLIRG